MEGVEEVRQIDETHLHWVAEIGGQREEWDAEITEQNPDSASPGRRPAASATPASSRSTSLSDERSKIMLQLDWEAEGMVEKVGTMLGQDDRQVSGDLERFKELVEERGSVSGARERYTRERAR